jgi:ATP-dependent DNA helicase RecG
LQDDIQFDHLGLAIVDEQHKFGVKQRSFFAQHDNPHIIQMSATPIPRSLALTYFGEFDVTTIDELPQ